MDIPPDVPYANYGEPPVWAELRGIVAEAGASVTIEPISKWDFHKAVESPDHVLTIQTADQVRAARELHALHKARTLRPAAF